MARHYLTAIEAETMARMFYKLPPRNYRGRPLKHQDITRRALLRKQLISGKYLTEKGLRELRSYCNWLRSKRA